MLCYHFFPPKLLRPYSLFILAPVSQTQVVNTPWGLHGNTDVKVWIDLRLKFFSLIIYNSSLHVPNALNEPQSRSLPPRQSQRRLCRSGHGRSRTGYAFADPEPAEHAESWPCRVETAPGQAGPAVHPATGGNYQQLLDKTPDQYALGRPDQRHGTDSPLWLFAWTKEHSQASRLQLDRMWRADCLGQQGESRITSSTTGTRRHWMELCRCMRS